MWLGLLALCVIYKVNGLKETLGIEAEGQGRPSRELPGITACCEIHERQSLCVTIRNAYLVFAFGSWPTVPKTLIISRVLSVWYVNEMTDD